MSNTNSSMECLLRLYVRGSNPASAAALRNLRALCGEFLADSCGIEVVDIEREIERAYADDIIAVPTLVRVAPEPVRRIIGDLTQRERVIQALDLRSWAGRMEQA